MVAVTDPAVLLAVAWLLVLFGTAWRHRFGSLPPLRALLVTSAALLWLSYSVGQVAGLLAPPYDDALGVVSVVLLVAGLWLAWRWRRAR